jgi:hypothetical protein
MTLPRRASTYILLALVLILAVFLWWVNDVLNRADSQLKETAVAKPHYEPPPALSDSGKPAAVFHGSLPTPKPQVDGAAQEMADLLNAPERTAQQDLEVVAHFIDLYRRAFQSGNPVGENMDITAAITGTADPNRPGRVFPPLHNAIRGGLLVDRWGSPLWFHPENAFKMVIRSAGPDKSLFTPDDVILE